MVENDWINKLKLFCRKNKRMAKVLSIVTYTIFPPRQGGQLGIALFNQYLSKIENLICFTVKSNDPALAPYPVLNQLSEGTSRYANPLTFFDLKKIIKEYEITHIILEHPYYGWMGFLLKYFCGVKLIIHSHNIEAQRFRSTGKWWWKILFYYEKWMHQIADFTFCITKEDQNYFHEVYKIPMEKTAVITYGIPFQQPPSKELQQMDREELIKKHQLSQDTVLYFFNGALQYAPNLKAVEIILKEIAPRLAKSAKFNYRIIICGKGLPEEIVNKLAEDKNIIYAGFVDDISIYYRGTDIFINPVMDGGGIKTKLVEALGNNLNAVSTENGAFGVPESLCNEKLQIIENENWELFVEKMIAVTENNSIIPNEYFQYFYWGNITAKAAKIIDQL